MPSFQTWQDFLQIDDVREMSNVLDKTSTVLQSQYAASKRIGNLGKFFQKEIDATENIELLKEEVADMESAAGVFLDWWGERVGVTRYIKVNGEYVRLDDDYYRFLLFYRARCNLSDSTCATMNRMLSQLTSERIFVVDYQDMTLQSIVIIGSISDLMATILQTYGLLNRPAGVMTNFIIIYPDEQIFGFEGSELQPFDQGVFNPGRTIGM